MFWLSIVDFLPRSPFGDKPESGENWRDMYKNFNCGVGIDVVGESTPEFEDVLNYVSQVTGVRLFSPLGICLNSFAGEKNRVDLRTRFGEFNDY